MYNNLGAFEELVLLLILIMEGEIYSVPLVKEYEQQTGRTISVPAMHTVLRQLENKGFVGSEVGGVTKSRGGRRKRIYQLTPEGYRVIKAVHDERNRLWGLAPGVAFA